MPCKVRFGPLGERAGIGGMIRLTVDEYETVRLIDYEGLMQEECAEKMQVARTTVQATYIAARKKIAAMLVEGKALCIEGGNFALCDGNNEKCRDRKCCQHVRTATPTSGSDMPHSSSQLENRQTEA